MSNEVQNIITGIVLIIISIEMIIFRKRILKNAKEVSDKWHYSREDREAKLIGGAFFALIIGIILIIYSFF
jgi:dolichol kinase